MKQAYSFYIQEIICLAVFLLIFGGLLGGFIIQNYCDSYYQPSIEGLQRQLDKSHEQLAKKTKLIAELTRNGG
ncbi:hypothetical protein [Streptococcus agalactiae]|uniref:hypothetical protein n=1 Tax=Streptococcus agalactiae TaxID=1311 RepID=UPI0002BC4B49|nr:hypothetical protein [Streptococcus agalactiae]EPT90715.1 hypothetical protein SAG0104_04920 [Streptococcus agalactiae BSU178]KLJ84258.1 hypothetical protein WB01_07750 [Streptococcus agalactiae]KLL20372.1 hypothetical protein VZ96_07085 [Streptococcus agalactiae]MCC9726835.1 hypothetical protein [Streptococcus agalactiae]CNB33896.1 phage membrane protein [Streptococcus agalactiae]